MKVFKILSHSYTLVCCFLFLLISGEHTGGFYALYLFMGLLFGALHSFLGFLGIVVILSTTYHRFEKKVFTQKALGMIGVMLLVASLFFFFKNDTKRYNWGTFDETMPLFTFAFTAFIMLCFLIKNFISYPTKTGRHEHSLSKL